MPVRSISASTCDQRQLDVAQQPGRRLGLELGVEPVGEVEDRAGADHVGLGRRRLVLAVEGQLAAAVVLGPQLAAQVAQRQVGEVVAALVGHREVRRQRGVAGDPGQLPAARGEGEPRPLGVVQRLGLARDRPATRRTPARRPGRGRLGSEPGALAVVPRPARRRRTSPVPPPQKPEMCTPIRGVRRRACSASQPASSPVLEHPAWTSKPSSASGSAASTVA